MKDALILIGAVLIAVTIGGWLYIAGPTVDTNPIVAGVDSVSFTELASGADSSIPDRKNFIIDSSNDLRSLWKIIGNTDEPPTVDFSKNEVVAVFAGDEPTAGYSIAVSNVSDTDSGRMVTITIIMPGGSCVLDKSVTHPYQIVEFAKTDLPLSHTDVVKTEGCL